MEAGLTGTNGYSMELRRHGATVQSYSAGNAIDTIDGIPQSIPGYPAEPLPWDTTTSMQIGSCSKLITAIAMTKLLAETGISPDAPIRPYLPSYWGSGFNVDLITFANLMANDSGLTSPSMALANQTYTAARVSFEGGVGVASSIAPPGQLVEWDYQNVTFALCRILMATVSGAVDVSYTYQDSGIVIVSPPGQPLTEVQLNDKVWDTATFEFYQQYAQENIFAPAGVTASLSRPELCALAYTVPPVTVGGWNSGDMTEYAGPTGWHLSVDGMLTVMGTFRRAGTIMSPDAAQAMLDARYGIDWGDNLVPQSCPAGLLYPKNGSDSDDGQEEQTSIVFLPLDMEFAVWVNSPVPGMTSLLQLTCTAFVDNVIDDSAHLGPGDGPGI